MLLTTTEKNAVLLNMAERLDSDRNQLLAANQADLANLPPNAEPAIRDRLLVDQKKIDNMIDSLRQVASQADPVGQVLDERELENGLRISNCAVPFGTIMIIYESRPDVTVEAACLAFKAGSRILLKGGREAYHSNKFLANAWQEALASCQLDPAWVRFLTLNRDETVAFLAAPPEPIDLIVPRGGDRLIELVKLHATCPVLVSGRGNNFLYVDASADWPMASSLILNGKLHKVSACNALDKVLLSVDLPHLPKRLTDLVAALQDAGVEVVLDPPLVAILGSLPSSCQVLTEPSIWKEEFLSYKILIGIVPNSNAAVEWINRDSGGHSATIVTQNDRNACNFMAEVDCAAVYHNASTRFTDGGQLGLGAELAISTDKLHHRGPLGLKQLVTNKYFIYGHGQIRK